MLPTDAQARKNIPIYSGFIKYFPDAMIKVAQLSKIGNDQHNPGQPLHWAKEKSGDELDAFMRHMIDDATGVPLDLDGVEHATKMAWRAMANLQRLCDAEREREEALLNEAAEAAKAQAEWEARADAEAALTLDIKPMPLMLDTTPIFVKQTVDFDSLPDHLKGLDDDTDKKYCSGCRSRCDGCGPVCLYGNDGTAD